MSRRYTHGSMTQTIGKKMSSNNLNNNKTKNKNQNNNININKYKKYQLKMNSESIHHGQDDDDDDSKRLINKNRHATNSTTGNSKSSKTIKTRRTNESDSDKYQNDSLSSCSDFGLDIGHSNMKTTKHKDKRKAQDFELSIDI